MQGLLCSHYPKLAGSLKQASAFSLGTAVFQATSSPVFWIFQSLSLIKEILWLIESAKMYVWFY
uniref:Uncharacterized protein n=1 Tax=Anguilla anguilla TaxID=7936 RepID=A0A0E9RBY7_ANGAN